MTYPPQTHGTTHSTTHVTTYSTTHRPQPIISPMAQPRHTNPRHTNHKPAIVTQQPKWKKKKKAHPSRKITTTPIAKPFRS